MSVFNVSKAIDSSIGNHSKLTDNIFTCKTFSKEYCGDIVSACDELSDQFVISRPDQPYAVDHLPLEYLGASFCHKFNEKLDKYLINSIVSFYGMKERPSYSLLRPYIARYSQDNLSCIGEHPDLSTFSFIIKLNEDYSGGELVFPKSDFICYNSKVEVGDSIIFPGLHLYPHFTKEVSNGTKYSLVGFLIYSGFLNAECCNHF